MWFRAPNKKPPEQLSAATSIPNAQQAAGLMVASTVELDRNNPEEFLRLRTEVHGRMRQEIADRIARNPRPTIEEEAIGAYRECLEPQVRDAVMTLWRKGYQTRSSGFSGIDNPQTQHILFVEPLAIDASVEAQLAATGTQVVYWNGHADELSFTSKEADIDTIRNQWNAAVAAMPDLGAPAPPMRSDFTDRAFVIYALEFGVTPDELAASPFATEKALREGMSFVASFT